jgi:hypothetical protein
METKLFKSKWWALSVPVDWEVRKDREGVYLKTSNDQEIKVTVLKKEVGKVSFEDLKRYSKSYCDKNSIETNVEWSECRGIRLSDINYSWGVKYFMMKNALMLVVSFDKQEYLENLNILKHVSLFS